MEFLTIDFYGIKRQLPLTFISTNKQIATFTIIGDVELTEKTGEELEKQLRLKNIKPDCFVGPGTNILCLVHHMAKRYHQLRYIILRKSISNYMISPDVQLPWRNAPKHAKKLVINGTDGAYVKGKKVVLIDDVVSTGTTIRMLEDMMIRLGAEVVAKCAIFKQGTRQINGLIHLSSLPIYVLAQDGKRELLTEEH
jgi:adenine phosphoribosyltransferase